jgi:hypothetical protein
MVDPLPKKNGFLTGYLKEILTGLLLISIMWVGTNVSDTKSSVKLINNNIAHINEKLDTLKTEVDIATADRYPGAKAEKINDEFRGQLEKLKDKVHALELKVK